MNNEQWTMNNGDEQVLLERQLEEIAVDLANNFWVTEAEARYVTRANPLLDKSFAFAVRIVNLHKWLRTNHATIGTLANQVLRSGTSIGANSNEADSAFSKREFVVKIGIALKEARETHYWLNLLRTTDYIDGAMFTSLSEDCAELIRLLTSIMKSTRASLADASKRSASPE